MKNNYIDRVAIIFNLKKDKAGDDSFDEYDDIETIDALEAELKALKLSVSRLEQSPNIISDICKANPDFVLNIAEGAGKSRARESQVPCVLESLNIPYWGSDPVALGVTLDKYLTNILLKSFGIPVPAAFVVNDESGLHSFRHIFKKNKLFIVKPRWEGSSKGIFTDSVAGNFTELKRKALYVISKYHQPALIEEFMENEEITVGLCGNSSPFVLGMMRIGLIKVENKKFLYSQENKKDWQEKIKYESAKHIKTSTKKAIEKYAKKAFLGLELRDVARIDFRLDKDNTPKIIDINPLPGLSPHYSDLPILTKLNGKDYRYLVRAILKESLKRSNLKIKAFDS